MMRPKPCFAYGLSRCALGSKAIASFDRSMYKYWIPIQSRWKDNDQYGHINNAEYYSYFDTVINHFLISKGGLDPMNSATIGLCVESKCNYFSSLEFPSLIEAGLFVSHMGKTSVKYEVGIFKEGSSKPSAHGHFVHVFVDVTSRKPAKFSSELENALASLSR